MYIPMLGPILMRYVHTKVIEVHTKVIEVHTKVIEVHTKVIEVHTKVHTTNAIYVSHIIVNYTNNGCVGISKQLILGR